MKPAPKSRPASSDARTRKIRAVLAACRRLGLDSAARKDLQQELTGAASMSDMNTAQLGQLLDHLNRDWKGNNSERAHIPKIKALWWSLYWLGVIDEPGERALSTFVKRQTGISSLRFLDYRHAFSVIEALKIWLGREGVEWKSDAEIAELKSAHPALGRAQCDRWSVIEQLTKRLFCNKILHGDGIGYASSALDLPLNRWSWDTRQLDDVIRLLGKKWRSGKVAAGLNGDGSKPRHRP